MLSMWGFISVIAQISPADTFPLQRYVLPLQ